MAATRSSGPSAHGKLHKRGNSAPSVNASLNPINNDPPSLAFTRSETPKVTYEEPRDIPRPAPSASNPLKIKPYLRKLSVKDNNTLDLSRPAAENQSLAGLGIHDYGSNPRSISDVSFSPIGGRSRHHRSTSNTSQFSQYSASSLQRPTAPYLRQTPRPYTPPLSKSSPTSIIGSDGSGEAEDIMSDEELRYKQHVHDPSRRSGSMSSANPIAQPLRIHTTGSQTRLGSQSQTSLPIISPTSRPRGDTLKSLESTTSPSSRTSFDKAFGFIRGRDSPIDPASRAASIRAARQAYEEKEAAKERKAEKEAMKQADRENRKQVKKEERQRRKSDAKDGRARSASDEKAEAHIAGKEYSHHTPAHSRSLPARVPTVESVREKRAQPQVTKSRAAKSRWLAFVTWFKTRLLRMGRKMNMTR